jgi:hypothetical protein
MALLVFECRIAWTIVGFAELFAILLASSFLDLDDREGLSFTSSTLDLIIVSGARTLILLISYAGVTTKSPLPALAATIPPLVYVSVKASAFADIPTDDDPDPNVQPKIWTMAMVYLFSLVTILFFALHPDDWFKSPHVDRSAIIPHLHFHGPPKSPTVLLLTPPPASPHIFAAISRDVTSTASLLIPELPSVSDGADDALADVAAAVRALVASGSVVVAAVSSATPFGLCFASRYNELVQAVLLIRPPPLPPNSFLYSAKTLAVRAASRLLPLDRAVAHSARRSGFDQVGDACKWAHGEWATLRDGFYDVDWLKTINSISARIMVSDGSEIVDGRGRGWKEGSDVGGAELLRDGRLEEVSRAINTACARI